jgi:hypothetical protein
MLKDWTGKIINFPKIEPAYMFKTDTININHNPRDYKILYYIDSKGCTQCKLHVDIWKNQIAELGSKADFLFYFYPKNEKGLLSYLKQEQFMNYPIYIDNKDELNKLNRFPNDPRYQCFLLNKDNKVLAIGNPVNPKIFRLYKRIITGEISNNLSITTVEAKQTTIELEDLQVRKSSEVTFTLKNTGKEPLIIQTVNASCGCTVPEWDKQPVATGKSAKIKVRITPEEKGYFNRTITVYCNTKKGQILLKIKGMVEQ